MSSDNTTSEADFEACLDEAFKDGYAEFMMNDVVLELKNRLSIPGKQPLSNDELAVIYDNFEMFSNEEVFMIPNVQTMGFTHYFIKESQEIVMVIKFTSHTFGLQYRDVVKPFLKNRHLCFCGRERKHGTQYCRLHKQI